MDLFSTLQIIVPVDFSSESMTAVDWAMRFAGRSSNVCVLHVCPSLILYEPAAVFVLREDEVREKYQEAFQKHFPENRYAGLRFDLSFGDPGSQVCSYAQSHESGLIVMTSHGRTGLSHLLLGSVAERVVRLAPCPVLVLRGDLSAAASRQCDEDVLAECHR